MNIIKIFRHIEGVFSFISSWKEGYSDKEWIEYGKKDVKALKLAFKILSEKIKYWWI